MAWQNELGDPGSGLHLQCKAFCFKDSLQDKEGSGFLVQPVTPTREQIIAF